MKTIERLTICVLLVILAFAVCGCKEKAEANEPAANWVEAVERWPDAQGYITDNFGRTTPMSTFVASEPNEPNESGYITIYEPNESVKYSLPIPTWPDYIELDKDLILRHDYPEPNNPLEVYTPNNKWIISKGTKIYFKD